MPSNISGAPNGEEKAQQTAGEREAALLGQELAHDSATTSAQRPSDGDLLLASEAAGEQQVGHVGAGDEQNAATAAIRTPSVRSLPAAACFCNGTSSIPQSLFENRILLRKTPGERVHLVLRCR